MNPGRLKHRIEIQEKKTVKDPVTKLPTETFVTVYSCWAEIEQPTGRRFFEAAVALGVFGVLLAGEVVQTVLANVGVSDFQEAAPPGGQGLVALGCVLGGWLGWRLANRG